MVDSIKPFLFLVKKHAFHIKLLINLDQFMVDEYFKFQYPFITRIIFSSIF